ncbi:MAG: sugar phosphate isomerase/epimerase [Clostridia bacterium]|nr:sugar phosphate isomerase/epimerase [Clostridia bacterium]
MKISTSTFGAFNALGIKGGMHALKAAGFDAIDLGLDALFPHKDTMDDEYVAYLFDENRIHKTMDEIRQGISETGLIIGQVHAPAAYVPKHPKETEIIRRAVDISIALCAELDCHHIVVHPILDGSARYPSLTKADEQRENIAYFSSLIPLLKKHRVICCIENAYTIDWGTKKSYIGACADMQEAAAYIDELNALAGEKCFGFCMDIGHLLILGIDPCNAMEEIGDRLEVLHVHDNGGYLDDHTAPFLGVCNWDRFIKGLRARHYQGIINLETSSFVQLFPKELVPASLQMLAATASYFRDKLR